MKGIDFTEENISLILKGKKWQTRRKKDSFKVGEVLYIREPFYLDKRHDKLTAKQVIDRAIEYNLFYEPSEKTGRRRNKRFMPSAFARYIVKIESSKSESLCDISQEDCIAEGMTSREDYEKLFDDLHGKGSFAANPIVFVYNFSLL